MHSHKFHWQKFSPFFGIGVVRIFITWFALAPIVVKVLEKIPAQIDFNLLSKSYALTIELPFNWAILWVASALYFLAFLLYNLMCPKFIRDFPDFAAFEKAKHSPRYLAWLLAGTWDTKKPNEELFNNLFNKKYITKLPDNYSGYGVDPKLNSQPEITEDATIFYLKYNEQYYKLSAENNMDERKKVDLFWEIFAPNANAHKTTRAIIWILVCCSVLLVLLVMIQQILFVALYLLGK